MVQHHWFKTVANVVDESKERLWFVKSERHAADNVLADKARKCIVGRDLTLGERGAATAVWAVMKAKTEIGTWILLGVLGSLVGAAAGIAKAINDNKAAQHQLQELQRHNRSMEGRGLYLAPCKRGQGISKRKNTPKRKQKCPRA